MPQVFLNLNYDYYLILIQDSKHIDACEMGELGQATKRAATQGAQHLTGQVTAFSKVFSKIRGFDRTLLNCS